MIVVSSSSTVEEMSGISIPIVHISIQQELGDAYDSAEAEVSQLQDIHEHDTALHIEVIEETREELPW